MNLLVSINFISIPLWILIILGFLMAFGITWVTVPSIVNISRLKNLCYIPNNRTSHTRITPTLGGIAVFAGLILSTVIFAGPYFKFELKYIISGLIIVFFIGIKDDILIIDPMKKLVGQILAAILVVVFADIRISDFYGLFYIHQISYIASILLTILVLIIIINGFNLIDGIDGLASGVGILTSSVFGIWFWISGNIPYALFSFSFVGSLTAFFYFNVFSTKNKLFLGDTGSLITGFVLGVLAIRFMQIEIVTKIPANFEASLGVVFGILVIPLFDAGRVFVLRIVNGKSPFKADHQHIHHYLLQLGFTHLQATLVLISVNLFFIVLSYLLRGIGILWLMSIILGLASLMSYLLVISARERKKEAMVSVLSVDLDFNVSKLKKICRGIIGKQPIRRIPGLKSPEKIHVNLKYPDTQYFSEL